MMKNNEAMKLVKRACENDAEAFSELIQQNMKDMYKVAFSILMNDEDAADAIQDTILVCWEKLGTLRKPRYFKTWLIRILINKCYDIRKMWQNVIYLDEMSMEMAAPVVNDNRDFYETLSILDEKYRSIMVLFYREGYHIDEIASILRLPRNTVKTRLKRGRDKRGGS